MKCVSPLKLLELFLSLLPLQLLTTSDSISREQPLAVDNFRGLLLLLLFLWLPFEVKVSECSRVAVS